MSLNLSQVASMGEAYIFFTLEYFLDATVREGLHAIEIWGGAPHIRLEDWGASDSRRLRHQLEERQLALACYTPEQVRYPANIAASEESLRERSVQYFLRHLEIASELGASQMLVSSGWGYLNEPVEDAWCRSLESLARITEAAESAGVALAFEPLQPKETNLVTNLPTLRRMLDELDSKYVHCCLDTVAMAVAGESVSDYFDALGDRVRHIHLNDGERSGHLSGHLAWGDGSLPLAEYIEVLESHNYNGFLTLEALNPRYIRNPDAALHQGMEALRPYLS